MNYRSLADMNAAIALGLRRLPPAIDAVVGIPRSGLLSANLACLALNVPVADLEGFCAGRMLSTGTTRRRADPCSPPTRKARVIVLDDSINSGTSMRQARAAVERAGLDVDVTFVAVYGNRCSHPDADIVLEAVPQPRFFQWNVMHHDVLKHACVDIDGVLCCDPTEVDNDDGAAYRRFLSEAIPLWRPSRRIGRLVTSRLEKYRPETEKWMRERGIKYDELHMLDLPSRAERLRLGAHARFKAEIYAQSDALLFIESAHDQATEIVRRSGKPVLCACCFELLEPDQLSMIALRQKLRTAPKSWRLAQHPLFDGWAFRRFVRGIVGERTYITLKRLAGR